MTYMLTLIRPDDGGPLEVLFKDVDTDEVSRLRIARDLREIAQRLDDGWQPRPAS